MSAGTLGQNVARARRHLGWQQQELAERLGVNSSLVSLLEAGKRLPSYELLLKLAEVLDVSLDQLAGRQVGCTAIPARFLKYVKSLGLDDYLLVSGLVRRLAEKGKR